MPSPPLRCSSGCLGAERDEERSRLRDGLLNRSVPRCRHIEEDWLRTQPAGPSLPSGAGRAFPCLRENGPHSECGSWRNARGCGGAGGGDCGSRPWGAVFFLYLSAEDREGEDSCGAPCGGVWPNLPLSSFPALSRPFSLVGCPCLRAGKPLVEKTCLAGPVFPVPFPAFVVAQRDAFYSKAKEKGFLQFLD